MYGITAAQFDILKRNINSTRIASRNVSGRSQSYLEGWDVKAALTRIFGYGNWDNETIEAYQVYTRDVKIGVTKDDPGKPGWEVAWFARVQLTIRNPEGILLCSHTESAVGSATASVDLAGLHDNAVKGAATDALKRAAINLGTQFGLSLYNNGSREDVVRAWIVTPDGWEGTDASVSDRAVERLQEGLGAQIVGEGQQSASASTDPADPGGDETTSGVDIQDDGIIRTTEQAAEAATKAAASKPNVRRKA